MEWMNALETHLQHLPQSKRSVTCATVERADPPPEALANGLDHGEWLSWAQSTPRGNIAIRLFRVGH